MHKNGVLLDEKKEKNVVKINKINVDAYNTLYVEIKKKEKKYIIGVVYKPPKLSEDNENILYDEIKTIIKDKNSVICGDLNNREPYDVIYLDFQKTFHKVPHQRLLSKLRAHGIGEHLCTWIGDWLSDRQQVVLNGEVSDWQNVISSVSQGSVLGPTLFLYVNDLESNLLSKVAKFADDTKLCDKVIYTEDCNKI